MFADDLQDGIDAYKNKDYKTAYKLWLPLAGQGGANLQFMLGMMHSRGTGVPQNYIEAVKWFRLAADQKPPKAQYSLGMMYFEGKGVPKDYVQAHNWFSLAG